MSLLSIEQQFAVGSLESVTLKLQDRMAYFPTVKLKFHNFSEWRSSRSSFHQVLRTYRDGNEWRMTAASDHDQLLVCVELLNDNRRNCQFDLILKVNGTIVRHPGGYGQQWISRRGDFQRFTVDLSGCGVGVESDLVEVKIFFCAVSE